MGVRAAKIWFNELMFSVKEPALKCSYDLTKSSQNQSVVKISLRWGKNEITFKAIKKYQYGLRKTVSKHLKSKNSRNELLTSEMCCCQVYLIQDCSVSASCFQLPASIAIFISTGG